MSLDDVRRVAELERQESAVADMMTAVRDAARDAVPTLPPVKRRPDSDDVSRRETLLEGPDGSIYLLAQSQSFSFMEWDTWLLALDPDGTVQWQQALSQQVHYCPLLP